jgi:hypothetical protein
VEQLGQGRGNGVEVADEASVVAGAHSADRGGHWPGQDGLHRLFVHGPDVYLSYCVLFIFLFVGSLDWICMILFYADS